MNGLKVSNMKKVLKAGFILLGILLIGAVSYLESGHYDSDVNAAKYEASSITDDYLTYENNRKIGFIFYPGGKVDSSAYSYLSELDANVYIAKFPFELAMFKYKVADQIIDENPQIEKWYIGGHSLGGVFANRYAVTTSNKIAGLVFLGSYPAAGDQSDIPGIAIFGKQDDVVGNYELKQDLFTDAQTVIEIPNANHSGFGNYGQQKGDSVLSSTQIEKQQQTIIKNINQFIDNQ